MLLEVYPDERKKLKGEQLKEIPNFRETYQSWYSEALACVSQLLPNCRDDLFLTTNLLRLANRSDLENYTVQITFADYQRAAELR